MSNISKKIYRHDNLAYVPPCETEQGSALVQEQLKSLAQKVKSRSTTKIKRILCLDGGGIKGAFSVSFISELQKKIDNPIGNYFDLIVGTSTGGIIALGLGLDIHPLKILDMYKNYAYNIFGKKTKKMFLHYLSSSSIYKREGLRKALKEIIAEKKLGDSSKRLVIPAWDNDLKKPYFYKTAHHYKYKFDHNVLASDIALATSAAPYYFEEYVNSQRQTFLDGGLFAINPIMIAVTEAVGLLNWDRHSLKIMSLGTTAEVRSSKNVPIILIKKYIKSLAKDLMEAQQKLALTMAEILVNEKDKKNIFRIDENFPEEKFKIDDPKAVEILIGFGEKSARKHFDELYENFFKTPAEDFNSIY